MNGKMKIGRTKTMSDEPYNKCRYCGFYGQNKVYTSLNGTETPVCIKCEKHPQKVVSRCRLNYDEVLKLSRASSVPIQKGLE
jgi:hypothetical protein